MANTIKYEENRCENYHTRRATVELVVPDGIDSLTTLEFATQLVRIQLDGRPSCKMKEFKSLARLCGQPEAYDKLEAKILED